MDLAGWDTEYVSDIAIVNAAVAAEAAKTLATFDCAEEGSRATGTFGAWSIVPGGSDQVLFLSVPITQGTLTMPSGTALPIAGVTVIVSVHLQLLPVSCGGSQLVFNFKSVGQSDSGPGVVELQRTVDPSGKLSSFQLQALGNLIAGALVQGAQGVSFVFASITPLTAGARWLTRAVSAYAFVATGDGRSALAIMSLTSNGDTSKLARTVDPALLATGSRLALAVSPALAVRNVFLGAIASSFGAPAAAFSVDSAGTLTGTFDLPTVSNAGTNYTPSVSAFSGSISDTQFVMAMSGSCDMKMNTTMTFSAGATLNFGIDPNTLNLQTTVASTNFSKHVDVPWYDRILDFLGAGIGAIIFEVSVKVIGDNVGSSISNAAANSAALGGSTTAITWAGVKCFKATGGGLAGCLYIRGSPA